MKIIIFSLALLLSFNSWAEDNTPYSSSSNAQSYNEIVDQLEGQVANGNTRGAYNPETASFLDDVDVHGGVGLVTSQTRISSPTGQNDKGFLKGLTAYLGIDLFNPYWIAELAFSTYSSENIGPAEISLKELDLKFYYSFEANQDLDFHFGAGLASRYMKYSTNDTSLSETTPASIFFIGSNYYLSPSTSVRFETSYRKAMISDTVDKKAFNAGVSMSAFF